MLIQEIELYPHRHSVKTWSDIVVIKRCGKSGKVNLLHLAQNLTH